MEPDMSRAPRRIDADADVLKALAHPLRIGILGALRILGASTATQLADRLGTSSGLTSYHLRSLAAAGLIEEDVDRGSGRDRWWRAAHDVTTIRAGVLDSAETATAGQWLRGYADRLREQEAATWAAESHSWPEQWRAVADRSDYYLLCTADELQQVLDDVHAAIGTALERTIARRDGDETVPGDAEHVRMHLLAFPTREVAGVRLNDAAPDTPTGTAHAVGPRVGQQERPAREEPAARADGDDRG